jgi:hypothetical protein
MALIRSNPEHGPSFPVRLGYQLEALFFIFPHYAFERGNVEVTEFWPLELLNSSVKPK